MTIGSQRIRVLVLLVAMTLAAVACVDASTETASEIEPEPSAVVPTVAPEPTAEATPVTPTPDPTATPTPTPTAGPTATPTPTPTPEPDDEPAPAERRCVQIVDFSADDGGQGWFIVNDGVMGGLSAGSAQVTPDGTALFEGEINTNGGGFSSIRTPIEPGLLSGTTALQIRARNLDGRIYEFLVDDAQPGRDRRISHFGPIPLSGSGDWETVEVPFDSLAPRVFGRAVESPAVDATLINGIGIILSDGIDGPFQLEVASINACEAAPEPQIET